MRPAGARKAGGAGRMPARPAPCAGAKISQHGGQTDTIGHGRREAWASRVRWLDQASRERFIPAVRCFSRSFMAGSDIFDKVPMTVSRDFETVGDKLHITLTIIHAPYIIQNSCSTNEY
jgi:hypothetical protein